MNWLVPLLAAGMTATAAPHPGEADGGAASPARNVLFLAIDDLREALGSLGAAQVRTPNLDRLAATGRLFPHHYAQVPTCGASRCCLLRGRYPEVPSQLGNGAITATGSEWADASLPGWFRRHGYRTLALGKISHHPGGRTGRLWADGPEELPGVWDRCWIPETPWGEAQNIMHGYANGVPRTPGKSPPYEAFDGPDSAYPDAWVADEAIRTLGNLAAQEKPWFFAVGFFKPHLPFAAPKRWFDLYRDVDFPAPRAATRPDGISGWHASGEFRGNYGHAGQDPENDPDYALLMRRAYAAATSYMDAQVGRVLVELERLGLASNTVVVAWGDHGFLLGEHAIWGKHCLYEDALRSPLIIRPPQLAQPGIPSPAIVETVDIFPTITALCGLPAPANLDGRSLVDRLDNPAAGATDAALGFWNRSQRTVRTDRWRLVAHEAPDGSLRGVELFDYATDPDEAQNVADAHPGLVQTLLARLDQAPHPGRQRQAGQ